MVLKFYSFTIPDVYDNMSAYQLEDKIHFSISSPVRALSVSLEGGSGVLQRKLIEQTLLIVISVFCSELPW